MVLSILVCITIALGVAHPVCLDKRVVYSYGPKQNSFAALQPAGPHLPLPAGPAASTDFSSTRLEYTF